MEDDGDFYPGVFGEFHRIPCFDFYHVSGHAAPHNPRTAGSNDCSIDIYVTRSLLTARVHFSRFTRKDNRHARFGDFRYNDQTKNGCEVPYFALIGHVFAWNIDIREGRSACEYA